MNAVWHPVGVYVNPDCTIEINCPTVELSESERKAFIVFWLDGVK